MSRHTITILLLAAVCTFASEGVADLPLLVQSASILLADSAATNSELLSVATQIGSAVNALPDDSLAPNALYLAMKCAQRMKDDELAHDYSKQITTNYVRSEFAGEAFQVAMISETRNSPASAAEYAMKLATKLAPSSAAGPMFKAALTAYQSGKDWMNAARCAEAYVQNENMYGFDAGIYLDCAEAHLKLGETDKATAAIGDFLKAHPTDPMCVVAQVRLALIESTLSKNEIGLDRFEKAWSFYSKNHKKAGFDQLRVLRAAARARYEIAEKHRQTDISALTQAAKINRKQFSGTVNEIEAAYQEAMNADSTFSPRCEHGIGNLHADYADALVKDGYQRLSINGFASTPAPYESALAEWESAVEAYERAAQTYTDQPSEHAEHHWSDPPVNWKLLAMDKLFALYSRRADVVYDWSDQLRKRAPQRSLGTDGLNVQFGLLVNDVMPLTEKSLNYRAEAVQLARLYPDRYSESDLEKKIDENIRIPMEEFMGLCRSQWSATRSTATQISRMVIATHNPATVATLRETVGMQIDLSNQFGREAEVVFSDMLSAIQNCDSKALSRRAWHAEAVQVLFEYSDLNRSISENLAVCLPELDPFDPIAVTLRTRLSDLSREAAAAEYKILTSANSFTGQWKVDGDASHAVYKRLAELNPTVYPPVLQGMSANR